MKRDELLVGARVGRWTVCGGSVDLPSGERAYPCVCDCGTEKRVLERSLLYGGSLSCGCLARDKAREKNSYQLEGRQFGQLRVLGIAEGHQEARGVLWTCLCSCGTVCHVPATLLVRGRKKDCGCGQNKNYYRVDISGQSFGRLTALYPTEKRADNGSVIWLCRCSCGKELEMSYNELVYSSVKSCGCLRKERGAELHGFLTHVSGTSLDMLKSEKLAANNTSGVKGVYSVKGKWMAKIVFQKKAYYLGSYSSFENAVAARRRAEEILFGNTVEQYEKWKQRSVSDPEWAIDNPFSVLVEKDEDGELCVSFSPVLI